MARESSSGIIKRMMVTYSAFPDASPGRSRFLYRADEEPPGRKVEGSEKYDCFFGSLLTACSAVCGSSA